MGYVPGGPLPTIKDAYVIVVASIVMVVAVVSFSVWLDSELGTWRNPRDRGTISVSQDGVTVSVKVEYYDSYDAAQEEALKRLDRILNHRTNK